MLVSLLFFLSGAAALVLQVLWTRMLGHVFGASALAVATTLSAFMGGLALGAHLGGKAAPKIRRPLLAFAALEAIVGVYGLLVPGLLSLMPSVQAAIGVDLDIGFLGHSVLRFVVVGLILLLPTTAMGATLPILAEGVAARDAEVAGRVSELYALNTAGAVLGSLLGGFVLIPKLGIAATVWVAAAIDLFVALLVVVLLRAPTGEVALTKERTRKQNLRLLDELDPALVEDKGPRTELVALLAFALSGAAAMALEVLWTRSVGVVIGASIQAFTLILATFLVGLSAGALAISRSIDRLRHPVRVLAWVEVGVAAFAWGGSLLIDRLPLWLLEEAKRRGATMSTIYVSEFLMGAAVMFPSTFLLGMVMPLVVRILAPRGVVHAGPLVGRAYTLNTLGAIAGSFLGGFVLLPGLGVELGLRVAVFTSALVGVLVALSRRPIARGVVAAGVALGVLLLVTPRWDVMRWTAGLFRFYLAKRVFADGYEKTGQVLFHRDGIVSTVTVESQTDGTGVALRVNGKVDASDEGDMPTQVLSGVLPLLVAEQAERVLVIGYGSGVTSGAVLTDDRVRALRLVEIERAVYEASNRHFAHVNRRPFEDPRFVATIDDGRNFLLTRPDTYDVIISEPSNPWMTGASSLFTEDFWRIAARRMRPGGVFLQWLQLYELSGENIRLLFRTFGAVFPHVLVFAAGPSSNDTLVLGSDRPLALDRATLERFFADPKLSAELARAEVEVPEDFYGLFLFGRTELDLFAGPGPLNTDDNAKIEFGAPLDLLEYAEKDADLGLLRTIDGRRRALLPSAFSGFDLDSPAGLLHGAKRLVRQGQLLDAQAFLDAIPPGSPELRERSLLRRKIRRLLEDDSQPVVVGDAATEADPDYARVVGEMLRDNEDTALFLIERADDFPSRSPAHRFLAAYLSYRNGRTREAEYRIERVLEDAEFTRAHPAVRYYAARIYRDRGAFAKASDEMERFGAAEPSAAGVDPAPPLTP